MSRSLSPREIAQAGFTHRVAGRARMACARLSNVTGAEDIGHQLSQTYASLPEWARDRLQRIGKSLVSDPFAHGASVFHGPHGATLTTLWLQRDRDESDEDVFVAVFLASATATGQAKSGRRREITYGARALPGTLRDTPMSGEERRAEVAPFRPDALDETDTDTSNWFTDVFKALVTLHQPRYLHLASSRRMIRAFQFMGEIHQTLIRFVHRVVDNNRREIDPCSTEGQLELNLQGLFSALDRDNLVQAQVGGKFSRSRENHLTITYTALPPGWRRDGTSTRPQLDLAAAPLVRLLVHALGHESRDVLWEVLRASKLVSPRNSPVNQWTWDPAAVQSQLEAFRLAVPDAPAPRYVTEPGERLFAAARSLDVYRLRRWLTAWERYVYEWEMTLPDGAHVSVAGIQYWREPSGSTVALMRVDLPRPPTPFAADGDFRRAEAALSRWTAEAKDRGAVIREARSRGTLPFLASVGTYRDGPYEYRLMSGRTKAEGRTKHTYQLRRQLAADGALIWRDGRRTLGEVCATVRADELHHAVADVASDLLRRSVTPRAHVDDDYAPLRPVFRRRMAPPDPLTREHAALGAAERAKELAFDMLSEPPIGDPADYRARIRERLSAAESEIQAIRARIALIENARAGSMTGSTEDAAGELSDVQQPTRTELEAFLAVIDRLRGETLVDGLFASGLQEFLRVRVERRDLQWAHFSVEVSIPADRDQVITLHGGGKVRARGLALPVEQDRGPEQPVPVRDRYDAAHRADIVMQMMAGGSDLVSLLPPCRGEETPTSAWGRRPRLMAAAHLAELAKAHGHTMGDKVAAVALRNPITDVRLALWRAIQGGAAPDALDPHFAAYVARSYLGERAATGWSNRPTPAVGRGDTSAWAHHNRPMAEVMRVLRARPAERILTADINRIATDAGGSVATIQHMLAGTDRAVPLLARAACTVPKCRANCRTHARLGLRPCQHADCEGYLDTPARIYEVPNGVLCSSCRRMPHPDSPVFPAEYLSAAEAYLTALMRYAPDVLAQRVRTGRWVPEAWLTRAESRGQGVRDAAA